MSDIPPQYEVLMDTYNKQQIILEQKRKEVEELKLEYAKVMQESQKEAEELEHRQELFNKKKALLNKELSEIVNVCQENEISNKKAKQILEIVDQSFVKIGDISDQNINTVQDVAKELVQIDEDLQTTNVRAQVQEFIRNEEITKARNVELMEELKRISNINPRLPEYETSPFCFWGHKDSKVIKELDDELAKIKNNIRVMENQIKEYESEN